MVVHGDDALIVDVKNGREQPWHAVQVMIYMYAVPRALPQYRAVRLAGEVVYPTHTVQVPRGGLQSQFIQDLGALIRRLADKRPATQVPSPQECRLCDISAADCPARIVADTSPEDVTTSDF